MHYQPSSALRALWHVPRRLLIALVRGYQRFISPMTTSHCRFQPTCSSYAVEALQQYGAVKGLILTIYRVGRCHPWGGQGYDPPQWFGDNPPAPKDASPRS